MNDSKKIKRRFIAGAVCPKCASMDAIVTYEMDGDQYRECVECDFQEKQHFKQQVRELDTRVNRTKEEIAAETQVVKLLLPSDSDESEGANE